jgi:two-component system NtrC family response regulator
MQAGEIGALQVRAALALGRHAEALAVVGRTRRGRRRLALEEAEALLGLMRPREALRVATHALRRRCEAEAVASLHLARARALWQLGATRRALAEAERARERAVHTLERAHAQVALAHFAWKEQRLDEAGRVAGEAQALYESARHPEGVVRALEIQAGVLRDRGRFDDALRAYDRRVEAAAATTRVDEMGQARADRGDLLAFLGRWDAAAAELDAAADLFRRLGDEREHTLARPRRAMVDLARGDLLAVRRAVERARECAFESSRLRAEHHLLASDLQLAAGEPVAAEREAREAARAMAEVSSREGMCRASVRLALSLVAQGRAEEGRRAAGRAVREAPAARRDLLFLSLLALGRAELRLPRRSATATFQAALGLGDARSGPAAAARLGLALAKGASPTDERVVEALQELEAWGDRRFLAYSLADLRARDLAQEESPSASGDAGEPAEPSAPCSQAAALATAAEALLSADSWSQRFAAALEAVRPTLGFCRAAWVGPGALELRPDGGVGALSSDDLAYAVTRAARGAASVGLEAGGLARHPLRALHALSQALAVPVPGGAWLYADFRGPAPAGALGRLQPLARLLAAAADAGVEPSDRQAAAFPEILGECEAVRELRRTIGMIGRSGLTVHVFGETGTGKEKVAEALHRASGRRGRLVCVNAAQLDDELFESAMFGHVKGAFTSASCDAEGYVAAAQGGTLFLDEVTELSPRGQAKLLRFLETGECPRLGDPRPRRCEVRVLSAANARLCDRVRDQRFREDLMYRLTGFTLALPPLRERGDDVLLLAQHFLRLHAAEEGVSSPRLGADAARALQAHAWPGNVRELRKQMHRAVVLASDGVVRVAHLQLAPDPGPSLRPTLRAARAAFERELVGRYLRSHAGCRARTAEALGITRQALALKLRQYGLS